MIPDPPANAHAHPYRGLSVQEIDVPLTQASLTRHLLGREVYRRTEYLALRGAGGRFAHVNFIWEPAPVPVRVTEVVTPSPPKLLAQAEQAVAFDEDLPPVRLDLDAVSVPALAAARPAGACLPPCRGTGADVGGPVAFLDTRPAAREDWLLIGCQRSAQLHRHFYGDEPERVDLCPRARGAKAG